MSTTPDLAGFTRLAAQHPGKLIPVYRRFLADSLTPVGAFARLAGKDYGFLLESVERGERVGRFSFAGGAPEAVFRGDILPEPTYTIEKAGQRPESGHGNVLTKLQAYLQAHAAVPAGAKEGVPPFAGGAVGYLGYDIVRTFEPRLFAKPPKARGVPGVPDVLMPVYRTIVAFDHVMNAVFVVHHADPREGGAEAAYARAVKVLDETVKKLDAPPPTAFSESEILPAKENASAAVQCNVSKQGFIDAVKRAQAFIAAGDIIQVVLSQRFSRTTQATPFEVYRSLRAVNPSPYMFYLRAPEVHVVGSSPEVMVRAEEGRILVRPIAGTRRRGKTPEEDAVLAAELLADEKERAEHVMLLDLGRNDVGRVSEYKSVEVTEKMVIENYSHVMHIVSNVVGRLQPGYGPFDVLRACHPAGTVSGAPKIRAMEIIDELEPDSRGVYAGAVGVLDWLGNLNTAIAIRTFVICPRKGGGYDAHVQAGAGLVADSVPEREFEECENKARALLRSLDAAEARVHQ
ncbi:MAG: anthranilate synthase component I [Planctomycetes bacterium]|nr:anthranilate synthase component I [Planctomycetota bacterium]